MPRLGLSVGVLLLALLVVVHESFAISSPHFLNPKRFLKNPSGGAVQKIGQGRAARDDYCGQIEDSFQECVIQAIANGSCKIDDNSGYLAFCPDCMQGYEGWIDCHCDVITKGYGLDQCHPFCSIFFWCASYQAYDYPACPKELAVLHSCMKNNTPAVVSSDASPIQTVDSEENDEGEEEEEDKPAVPLPKVTKELIFESAPIKYCHACSLIEKPNGDIVATFSGGPFEDSPQDGIWYSIRDSKSGKWTPPGVAIKIPGLCSMNPSLFQNPKGTLYLMFHSGGAEDGSGRCNTDNWHGSYVTSSDGGKTWNQTVVQLPPGFLGGIKNKCIQISNGNVLCPASTEAMIDDLIEYWRAHIEITDVNFAKWQKANYINFNYANTTKDLCVYYGTIQPTLFEVEPGKILAMLRSGCKVIAQSWSNDYGRTWDSIAAPTSLPNPNAGIDGVLMKNQRDLGLMLVFNDSPDDRTPLTLAQSFDGKRWTKLINIEGNLQGSFEYPAIIQSQLNPRKAHVCYTHTVNNKRVMGYATLDWS